MPSTARFPQRSLSPKLREFTIVKTAPQSTFPYCWKSSRRIRMLQFDAAYHTLASNVNVQRAYRLLGSVPAKSPASYALQPYQIRSGFSVCGTGAYGFDRDFRECPLPLGFQQKTSIILLMIEPLACFDHASLPSLGLPNLGIADLFEINAKPRLFLCGKY